MALRDEDELRTTYADYQVRIYTSCMSCLSQRLHSKAWSMSTSNYRRRTVGATNYGWTYYKTWTNVVSS